MTTTIVSVTTPAPNLPLTTLFTPPSSCDNLSWVSSDCLGSTCERIYNIVRATETECYPSGWETSATTFSPGIICPSGYSIAATTLAFFGAASVETRATCCPSGFTVATENAQAWYEREPCIMRSKGVTTVTYKIVGTTPTSTTAIVYPTPIVHAMPVGIAWQSTDIMSDIMSTLTATSSSSPTTTSTPTSTPIPEEIRSGLSTGAKAGIGVGASVGLIAIALAFGACFWFRRRRNQGTQGNQDSTPRAATDAESTRKKTSNQDYTELGGIPLSSGAVELQGDQPGSRELSNKAGDS